MIPSAIVAKNVVKRYRRGGGLNGFRCRCRQAPQWGWWDATARVKPPG